MSAQPTKTNPETPDADLGKLLPCPFCGGGISHFQENGRIWTGTRYGDPVSVSVQHWCDTAGGIHSRMIEKAGKTKADAIALWNTRQYPSF